jgi:aspartate/glutamate racemase
MSKIRAKKFKKLQKELEYWQSELEYVQEILEEYHLEFDEYHREYCAENNIDLAELNRRSSKRVDRLIPDPVKKTIGPVVYENKSANKIYKQIAKKLHPDIGGDQETFKEVTAAFQEKNLKKLLDICEEHDIIYNIDDELIKMLDKQIADAKKLINKEKSTYSWSLYNCKDNSKCKQKVVKKFLKHLFNYEDKK